MPVTRPRMRASDGSGELPLTSCELFSQTEALGWMAMQQMLAGLSTRRYPVGLEPVGRKVESSSPSTSKSAVSRRFVAATETALAELLVADLHDLDLVALLTYVKNNRHMPRVRPPADRVLLEALSPDFQTPSL